MVVAIPVAAVMATAPAHALHGYLATLHQPFQQLHGRDQQLVLAFGRQTRHGGCQGGGPVCVPAPGRAQVKGVASAIGATGPSLHVALLHQDLHALAHGGFAELQLVGQHGHPHGVLRVRGQEPQDPQLQWAQPRLGGLSPTLRAGHLAKALQQQGQSLVGREFHVVPKSGTRFRVPLHESRWYQPFTSAMLAP